MCQSYAPYEVGTCSIRRDHPEMNKHENGDLNMEVLKMEKIRRFYIYNYTEGAEEQNWCCRKLMLMWNKKLNLIFQSVAKNDKESKCQNNQEGS